MLATLRHERFGQRNFLNAGGVGQKVREGCNEMTFDTFLVLKDQELSDLTAAVVGNSQWSKEGFDKCQRFNKMPVFSGQIMQSYYCCRFGD